MFPKKMSYRMAGAVESKQACALNDEYKSTAPAYFLEQPNKMESKRKFAKHKKNGGMR